MLVPWNRPAGNPDGTICTGTGGWIEYDVIGADVSAWANWDVTGPAMPGGIAGILTPTATHPHYVRTNLPKVGRSRGCEF